MIYPDLPAIDWPNLTGGDIDATSAIAARDRKLAMAAELAETVVPLASRLADNGATFECSSELLTVEPLAARWYLDLAGLTDKTIAKLKSGYVAAGLPLSPETIANNCRDQRSVQGAALEAFSCWINEILVELYPVDTRTPELALTTVLALMGARIDGSVRNKTGDDAVVILKTLLVGAFSSRSIEIDVPDESGGWEPYSPASNLLKQKILRFGRRLECEFIPGGNRPDIKIKSDGVVILLGEVKGRSDLSNVWESWIPQINGHLQTWAGQMPHARRVLFGTIITQEMIDGMTPGGTQHTGLRAFANSGILNGAYNLTNTAKGDATAVASFENLVDQLVRNLAE